MSSQFCRLEIQGGAGLDSIVRVSHIKVLVKWGFLSGGLGTRSAYFRLCAIVGLRSLFHFWLLVSAIIGYLRPPTFFNIFPFHLQASNSMADLVPHVSDLPLLLAGENTLLLNDSSA